MTDNETIAERFFLVSYVYQGGVGYSDFRVKNGFLNHRTTIEQIRSKINGYQGGISITSIFEFKSKEDYDDFCRESIKDNSST